MGYQEAIKIANANANAVGDIVCEVIEFNDRFVISYEDREGNVPDVSPIFVLKESGDVGTFFPPDYDGNFLKSGQAVFTK